MDRTLNDEQRKLVEDNHNLIFSFLKSRSLSLDAVEDWYGIAAIGLCKAALVYDKDRNYKFSTLAYVCMDNEVRQVLRKNRKDIIIVSLDDEVEGGGCALSDIIADREDCYYSTYLNDAVRLAYNGLEPKNKQIVDLMFDCGLSQRDVAAKFNLSQPTVSRIYSKFLKKIRDYLYESDKAV